MLPVSIVVNNLVNCRRTLISKNLDIVRRICAKICDNRGFLRTSMKLGRDIEHDLRNNLRSGGTSDLTFGGQLASENHRLLG